MDNLKSSIEIGNLAEYNANEFLKKQGLMSIEKNFIAYNPAGKKVGEIDLIMRDKHYYVFVEVKLRKHDDHGDVLEMITSKKQARIILAAKYYLLRHGLWDRVFCRFDVIGISPQKKQTPILWIKNAFEVQC